MGSGLFNVNGAELVVILLVVALVVGPDRLPDYARQLAQFVRAARDQVTKVRERVDEEVQAELGDVDWKALDPRQYDPRRIVREALLDESGTSRNAAAGASVSAAGASVGRATVPVQPALAAGEPAPFDDEAT